MEKVKEIGKKCWRWTISRVEALRSRLPHDFISSPLAKWIGGFILLAWLAASVVSYLRGDPTISRLEIVQAGIAMLGLAGLAANAWFTLKRANAIEEQVKVSDDSQITERFSRAIEHLGSGIPQIMIGGIYALERIAKDYQNNYHQTVMEVLTAFIRGFEREEPVEQVPPELQAAVTVVCRRDVGWEQANLTNFELDLKGANLSYVQMQEAKFVCANLMAANLTSSNLYRADLTLAAFSSANLTKTYLVDANMKEASLPNACLASANLAQADLTNANLGGADLTESILYNTNLTGALYLTVEQLLSARHWEKVTISGDIRAELDSYIEAKQAEAKPTAVKIVDPKGSIEDKLPDADVSETGEPQDEPGARQEDVEGSG